MKTGSSSSDSSDSSDSEDSDNGEMNFYLHLYSLSSQWFLMILLHFHLPGLVPKEQKKTTSNKDTKRPQQPLVSVAGPPQPQIEPQPVQSKPSFVPAPPVSVPSLDSSHLLNSGFDPLLQFMNPHLTQSNTEPNPTISTASAPAAPGLLSVNEPTGHLPSDTHPFLNQHPIIPSPGRSVTTTCFQRCKVPDMLFIFLIFFCSVFDSNAQRSSPATTKAEQPSSTTSFKAHAASTIYSRPHAYICLTPASALTFTHPAPAHAPSSCPFIPVARHPGHPVSAASAGPAGG